MKVLIRTDGTPHIGLGHVVRSVAIAEKLCQRGTGNVKFLSNYNDILKTKITDFPVIWNEFGLTEEDFILNVARTLSYDVIIIDNLYNYSVKFVKELKKYVTVFMIHNQCEGVFESDYAIFPIAHLPDSFIQDKRWQRSCAKLLYGAQYTIIGNHILELKTKNKVSKKTKQKNIVFTFGGSDPRGILLKVLPWIIEMNLTDTITILLGEMFFDRRKLDVIANVFPENIIVKDYNPSCFVDATLAICSFGVTTYELIYLGVPALVIGHSPQNAKAARVLAKRHGVIDELGGIDALSKNEFQEHLSLWLKNEFKMKVLSNRQRVFLDGKGVDRITKKIMLLNRRAR